MPAANTTKVFLLFTILAGLTPLLLTFSETSLVSASALPGDNISSSDDVLKERILRAETEKPKEEEEEEEEEVAPKIDRFPGEEEKNHTTIHWIVGDPKRKLQCTAKGTPKIKWHWVKLGVVEQKLTAAREDEVLGLSELEFLKVDFGTEGYYKCLAKNDEGSDFRLYHVIVDKPELSTLQYLAMIRMEEDFAEQEGPNLLTIAIATISALAIVVLTGFLIYLKVKNHRYKQEIQDKYISEEDIEEFKFGAKNKRGNLYADVAALSNELIEAQPYDAQFEIPRNKIFIYEHLVLGSGEYGIVIQGAVHNPRQGNLLKVAVKTLKSEAELLYFKALLSELKIMAFLGKHANVVNLVGACTENLRRRELLVAVEFCHFGNLKDFLTRNRAAFVDVSLDGEALEVVSKRKLSVSVSSDSILDPQAQFDNTIIQAFSQKDLIKWSYEIAKGMEFLASKKVVHADLAARNILLTKCLIAKISDFGLSKQLMNYTNYVKKQQCPLPWRWMSIESLQDYSFSIKSDVWSYGVCLWELFSLGQVPYPGQVWSPDFLKQLVDGLRLGQPKHASDSLYSEVISPCWKADPGERPDFFLLKQRIESVLYSISDQEYMDVLNSKYEQIMENCVTQLYSEMGPEQVSNK